MTQTQIRVVRDALDRKFKDAIGVLQTLMKDACKTAERSEEKDVQFTGKNHAKDLTTLLMQVNSTLKLAEKDGVQLLYTRRSWCDEIERVSATSVQIGLTDKAKEQCYDRAAEPFQTKINKLETLKEQTYLSLYDSVGLKLSDIVLSVAQQITTIMGRA